MRKSMGQGIDARRASALALAADRAKRSPQDQLARLDSMFGKGKGASKERARLAAQVEAVKEAAKETKKKKKEPAEDDAVPAEPKKKRAPRRKKKEE